MRRKQMGAIGEGAVCLLDGGGESGWCEGLRIVVVESCLGSVWYVVCDIWYVVCGACQILR